MKDKILYLIEWPVDVGIARSIKEKHDCEIYALVDTNEYLKKFFEAQNLIKFEKTWYYRDHILDLKGQPDMEYLARFENKYKINLWMIAYMDRIFYAHNNYHKFTDNEILLVLEHECKLYEKIIEESKPDFVIIKNPDYNQSQLLLEFCKANGIHVLTLSDSRFSRRFIISEKTGVLDNYEQIVENYSDDGKQTLEDLRNHIEGYSSYLSKYNKEFAASWWKKFKASFKFIILICNNKYRKYYVNFGRTRRKILFTESSLFFKMIYRERFMRKNFVRELEKNTPFVYFPLHFQPERSTLMDSPFYINQLEVIENIAKSLPVEYKLYVKEHPGQILNGWRDKSYYKAILKMPNVLLLHPSVSNDELLKNCSLVITITGTLGLQAAFYLKPSIVFADVGYSHLPSVYRLKSPEDLPNAIRAALKTTVNISDLRKYVNCMVDNSFEFDFLALHLPFNRYFHGGFVYYQEIPTNDVISILEENKPLMDILVYEYLKKIEFHKKRHSKIT